MGLRGITTADLHNTCTSNFGGTSASAPVAAGAVALALQANPCLGWRDVQHLIVRTAVVTDASDPGWATNAAGRRVSHKYGFGAMDAGALVDHALDWSPVGAQLTLTSPLEDARAAAPVTRHMELSGCTADGAACIDRLEHVTVSVNMTAQVRGGVSLMLQCPSGTRSMLLRYRSKDRSAEPINWTFMTTHCWDEPARGTYALFVETTTDAELLAWSVTLHGSSSTYDFSAQTHAVAPQLLAVQEQRGAAACYVCGAATFRGLDGTCWQCDGACEHGCFGPGPMACVAELSFGTAPAHTHTALIGSIHRAARERAQHPQARWSWSWP